MVHNKIKNAGIILSGLAVLGFIGLVFLMIFGNIQTNVGFSHSGNATSETTILNNGASSTLSQTPSSGFTAKVNNQTWLDFNNSARATIDENFNYTNPFTVSFWFKKPTTTDAAAGFMICKSDSTGNQRSWQFHTNTGNDVFFLTHPNGTNTNVTTSQWNNFVVANQWYHIAGVYNGSSLVLYGNGVQQDSDIVVADPNLGSRVFDGTANVTLGNCQNNAGFYNGSLDEIIIYNRALGYSEITDLFLNGHENTIMPRGAAGYFDDFSSYAVGVDTVQPNWIPQYTGTTNITSNQKLQLNYLIQQSGDRDLHVELNRSEISRGIQNITAKFQFNVTQCNTTFFATEGIGNIGASAYFWYADGNNFLSMETKTNATNITVSGHGCGSGEAARFTIYKRVGGVTTALNPQTFYTFNMSTLYNVTFSFTTHNSTNYNLTAIIEGVATVSSNNITIQQVLPGIPSNPKTIA